MSVLICRRRRIRLDNNHRSTVAVAINQIAIVRVLNTIKARSLQSESIFPVGSTSQPDNIRGIRPMTSEITSTDDEATNKNAQGFDFNVR